MIFVTVGTQLTFDRLVMAVDAWAKDHPSVDVFGQISDLGPDNYAPRHFKWSARIEPADFERYCDEATLIVAHAGTGSIISALMRSKPVLVMPRRLALREHRNDHQLATVDHFKTRPGVFIADQAHEVGPLIDAILGNTGKTKALGPFAEDRLIDAVRAVIHK
ncbi:MAG: glycosyltransferase [Alphaproteobacteria bacterium]